MEAFGLIILVVVGIALLSQKGSRRRNRSRSSTRRSHRTPAPARAPEKSQPGQIAAQTQARSAPEETNNSYDALCRAKLSVLPLLNKEERQIHANLDSFVATEGHDRGMRLFAQVALDEVFRITSAPDAQTRFSAHAAFRQKRVDFLIVDSAMQPLCGIEYQGSGHHQGNSAKRDRVKAKAFEEAGLPLVIVDRTDDWSTTLASMRAALNMAHPMSRHIPTAAQIAAATPHADTVKN